MHDADLDRLRAALAARLDACWNRLDDAVDELLSLHDVDLAAIIDHVAATSQPDEVPQAQPRHG
jgi:hypothetical protein